jgi:hypothetical protein
MHRLARTRTNPRARLIEVIDEAIDQELLRRLREGHSLDAESMTSSRLRFARWVLTADDDQIDEALVLLFIPELEDEGIWDPESESGG